MSKYSIKKNTKEELKNDALKMLRDSDLKGNLRLNLLTKINSGNQNSVKSAIETLKTVHDTNKTQVTMTDVKAHKTMISKNKEATKAIINAGYSHGKEETYQLAFKDVTQFNKVYY